MIIINISSSHPFRVPLFGIVSYSKDKLLLPGKAAYVVTWVKPLMLLPG